MFGLETQSIHSLMLPSQSFTSIIINIISDEPVFCPALPFGCGISPPSLILLLSSLILQTFLATPLCRRIKGQFESADLDGSGSITLASQEWEHLRGFLAENGFPLEARDVDLDGDGEVRRMELLRAITQRMDHHMGDLKHAMQKQRDLRRQLEEKRREVERKKINM